LSVKILQVGVGIRGSHWVEFVRDHPDTTAVGFVDPVPAALDRARATCGRDVPVFADLDEALRATDADAALIASPSTLHAEHAIRALDAGLAVMIEKPFAVTVADAQRVIDRGRKTGLPVLVAENYRFRPAERTVRKLVQEGRLGRMDSVTFVDRRHMPSHTEGPWLATIDYPQLQEVAIHHFDSLRAFLEPTPTSVTARVWNPPWSDYRHGASTEALLQFGGIRVQYLGTLLSHRFSVSIWLEGEEGVLWTNRKRVLWRPKASRWWRPVRNVAAPPGDEASYPKEGTTSLLNSLRDAVKNGTRPETHGGDNIWNVAMVEAGKLSDREKRTVEIAELYSGPTPS
jgi:predicted dehydrogenase